MLRLIKFEAFRSVRQGGAWWVFVRDIDTLGPWRVVQTSMTKGKANRMVESLSLLPHQTQAAIHDERAQHAPTLFGTERIPTGFAI